MSRVNLAVFILLFCLLVLVSFTQYSELKNNREAWVKSYMSVGVKPTSNLRCEGNDIEMDIEIVVKDPQHLYAVAITSKIGGETRDRVYIRPEPHLLDTGSKINMVYKQTFGILKPIQNKSILGKDVVISFTSLPKGFETIERDYSRVIYIGKCN